MTIKLTREEAIQDLKAIKSFERYARGRLALDVAIEALQTEIVRCKDCKYIGKVGDISVCRIHEISIRADDYCSRGERSEDE